MKSLRSSGDRHRRAHRAQVRERAVEERRLGQHGDRRRAGRRVAARDRHRIVVGAQHAARRRSALALGDDVDAIGAAERRAKRARPRRRARPRGAPASPIGSRASRTSTIRRVAATIVSSRSAGAPVDWRHALRSRRAARRPSRATRAVRASAARRRSSMARDARRMPSSIDAGLAGDEQRRARVQQHDVARRPALAGEHARR